ncbi:RusA family crossover junction endodeoxyribonuclease, partial [Staphylococcus gallinarum]
MAKIWKYTIDLPPMGTPRPRTRRLDDGRTITYYDRAYSEYLDAIQARLIRDKAINDDFFDVVNTELGVKAEVMFYVQAPRSQNRLKKLTRTTAPDI